MNQTQMAGHRKIIVQICGDLRFLHLPIDQFGVSNYFLCKVRFSPCEGGKNGKGMKQYFGEVEYKGLLSTRALSEHIAAHGSIWTRDIVEGPR